MRVESFYKKQITKNRISICNRGALFGDPFWGLRLQGEENSLGSITLKTFYFLIRSLGLDPKV